MMIRKGMRINEVLKERFDLRLIDEYIYDGKEYKEYEGHGEDCFCGISIEVENGIVVEIEKFMYL